MLKSVHLVVLNTSVAHLTATQYLQYRIVKVGRWLFSGHSSVLEHSQLTLEDMS